MAVFYSRYQIAKKMQFFKKLHFITAFNQKFVLLVHSILSKNI